MWYINPLPSPLPWQKGPGKGGGGVIWTFIQLFFFCYFPGRFYKFRVFDVPTTSSKTSTFSCKNPGFKEAVYSETLAKHHTDENTISQRKSPGHEVDENRDVILRKTNYQQLPFVNGRPEPTYAARKTCFELSDL